MRCAWMRALTSIPPPAAKGTMSVIGRVGHSCAAACALSAITIAAAAIILCMLVSLLAPDIRAQRPRDQGRRCRGRMAADNICFAYLASAASRAPFLSPPARIARHARGDGAHPRKPIFAVSFRTARKGIAPAAGTI
jgi:hypothetical protein